MINFITAFVLSLILGAASVGILEVVKNLIPAISKANAVVKTIISIVIELIVAILGVVVFGKSGNVTGIIYDVVVVLLVIGFAQIGYETFVKFIKKLTDFLKSKITSTSKE